MWRYPIVYCVFLVFLHNTYCCYCNQQNGLVNTKGETGNDFKRQLDVEEYSGKEVEIETVSRADLDINNSQNYTYSEENFTNIDAENYTSPSTPLIEDVSLMTLLTFNMTTERSAVEDLNTPTGTITTDVNTTTESFISDTNLAIEANVGQETNVTNGIVAEPLYTEQNMGKDVTMYCSKYKNSSNLELNKMADIWKIAYYTMPHKLKCFKLHIKLLTADDKKYYSQIYGNFNNKINWEKCELEIMSRDNNNVTSHRKHFLQGHESVPGVMKNIIIEEDFSANTSSMSLVEEVPDQWLVVKNLLLMRDCSTGELVIFTRVPMEPKIIDIEDALAMFNEPRILNGTRACL